MNNSDYMNYILNGHNPDHYDADQAEDALYTEIEDAVVYIAQIKVDNCELELEIDDIEIDLKTETARVTMSNDDIEVQLDYDHKTGNWNAYQA
jgi:hypothetical protein